MVSKFLEFGLLQAVQVARDFDNDSDVQIAVAVALQAFYTFALKAKDSVGLSAGGNSDVRFASERGNFNFCAERRLDKLDGNVTEKIVAITLENFMLFDMENHVEIAMRPSTNTGFAISGAA